MQAADVGILLNGKRKARAVAAVRDERTTGVSFRRRHKADCH